jgi:methyltransferase OMS1
MRWFGTAKSNRPQRSEGEEQQGTAGDNASSTTKIASDVASYESKDVERRSTFLEPSDDIVMEYARNALQREGRDKIPEAVVWKWETTHYPILAQGKQNFFDYTDDIPLHVKPLWHHEYYQQREYFKLQREKKPFLITLRNFFLVCGGAVVFAAAVAFVRVWVAQPKEVQQLREALVQQSFGRVLELSAGHGQNIGTFPYAVHEIVMTDSNSQVLQALRYRIPKTAYPKYEIKRVRSEHLEEFKDGEFDCVIDMFGLCHVHDPVMALRQMQRVVKPTGVILLLEHGRSPYPPVNWFLDYFAQRHTVNTHGCQWNLPIRDYLKESRMEIKEIKNYHYGTTYYVVAFPEQLDPFQDTAGRVSNARHSATPAPAA